MENDVMQKKFLISLGLIAVMSCGLQAYANTTIYTDDLGRMHFLGKDNGTKTLQKLDDYDNPKQVDILPNTTYGRNNVDYYEVTNIKSIEKKEDYNRFAKWQIEYKQSPDYLGKLKYWEELFSEPAQLCDFWRKRPSEGNCKSTASEKMVFPRHQVTEFCEKNGISFNDSTELL